MHFHNFHFHFPLPCTPLNSPFPTNAHLFLVSFLFVLFFGDSLSLIKVSYMDMDRDYLLNYGKFNYGYIMEENDSLFPINQ